MIDVDALITAIARSAPEKRRELAEALGVGQVAEPCGLVSPREYAARHSIGVSTVRAHIRAGRLAAVRLGGSVRIAAGATIAPSKPAADSPTARAEVAWRKVGAR